MLVYLLLALLPAVLGSTYKPKNDETDIFPYVIADLSQFKLRQLAESTGDVDKPAGAEGTTVCYDELGCFDRNGTFKHLKQLPDTPENIATQFLLYTRKNLHVPQILDYMRPETVVDSFIDPKHPLKFIVHGFGGKNNITWMWNMKNAFLEKYEMNVIAVDWSKGAAIPHYINAAVNAELVGAQIAALYYIIKDELGIPEANLHVIGFSLGAHVSGFVGKRMQSIRGTKPGRITGLDPASPVYEDYGGSVHLFKTDAEFVDVIHTNADLLIYGGVGMGAAIGDVDFYPNGGIRQPGCPSTLKGAFLDLLMKGNKERVCNHERAVHLFTESILNHDACRFASFPCDDFETFSSGKCFKCEAEYCGLMGYQTIGTGVHYLLTDQKVPFCTDSAVLTIHFSAKNKKKSYGSIILTLVSEYGEKHNITVTQKDEKLLPKETKTFLLPLNEHMHSIKEIHAFYIKYNGWFFKGTDTYTIGHVEIKNTKDTKIFKSCAEVELPDSKKTIIPNDFTC